MSAPIDAATDLTQRKPIPSPELSSLPELGFGQQHCQERVVGVPRPDYLRFDRMGATSAR